MELQQIVAFVVVGKQMLSGSFCCMDCFFFCFFFLTSVFRMKFSKGLKVLHSHE